MRIAMAALILIFLTFAAYQLAISHTQLKYQNVRIEGRKLILSGFETPVVRITGCGQSENFTGNIVDISINCSEITVKVYSKNQLVFSGTFPLNT